MDDIKERIERELVEPLKKFKKESIFFAQKVCLSLCHTSRSDEAARW
jgi:hypothetical protein